jgi:hypothetical protein
VLAKIISIFNERERVLSSPPSLLDAQLLRTILPRDSLFDDTNDHRTTAKGGIQWYRC